MNEWIQWILVFFIVMFIRTLVARFLGLDFYTIPNLDICLQQHNWGGVFYRFVTAIGNLFDAAYFLRAMGFIEFIKEIP